MRSRVGFPLTASGAALAVGGLLIAGYNVRALTFLDEADDVEEKVAVLVPARNAAADLPALIADLRAQTGVPDLSVVILDDDSDDETFRVAETETAADARFRVIRATGGPPPGWLGKSAACHELVHHAVDATVLVFVDADLRLAPTAVNAAVNALRRSGAALISPWPHQQAGSRTERLVQPLLAWSWMSTLPTNIGNRSLRPSTAVACGQFLVFDAAAYRDIGGHASVASAVTEDLAIARELRRNGYPTHVVGAGQLAWCRMYTDWPALRDGHAKWLWSQFGSMSGSAAVIGAFTVAYLVPPIALLTTRGRTRIAGMVGFAAAVGSRAAASALERRTYPNVSDAIAALSHPAAIATFSYLTARSHVLHRRGKLSWRGRALP